MISSGVRPIILFASGRSDEAEAAFAELEAGDGDEYQMAELAAVRGDVDKAFEWLELALEKRDPGVTHTKASPRLRSSE